jgi:ABC-2 type transport system ATP-binding protein
VRRDGVDAIVVDKLRKQFDPPKGPVAVDGVSFSIREGEIFSLLGPNGAGKTTTISILSCLLKPDSGEADVGGFSVVRKADEVKKLIGVVPQDIALYEDLSGRENLMFWGRMYGLSGTALTKRVDEVLELIGLTDRQKDRVDKYSGGMKRRVNIGAALLHKPKMLYLDEPTVGIDPQSRRSILDGVKELNAAGMTVLYTTHYMEEAQELSDRIGIMDTGKMVATGTQAELVKLVGEKTRIDLSLDRNAHVLAQEWRALAGVTTVTEEEAGPLSILVDDANTLLPQLLESARVSGARVTKIDLAEPNLEMVFLELTGRALRD